MATIVSLRRDPYARATLKRALNQPYNGHKYRDPLPECEWCGSPARFSYRWEPDEGRNNNVWVVACSVECYATITEIG